MLGSSHLEQFASPKTEVELNDPGCTDADGCIIGHAEIHEIVLHRPKYFVCKKNRNVPGETHRENYTGFEIQTLCAAAHPKYQDEYMMDIVNRTTPRG